MRICVASILVALMWPIALAGAASQTDTGTTSPTAFLTCLNYDIAPDEATGLGVRAMRITDSSDIPGGPWAVGAVGDYVADNGIVRVVVRGPGQYGSRGIGSTGEVVDITFVDDMWDRFGSLSQFVRAEGTIGGIVYDRVEIRKDKSGKVPPSIVAFGKLPGRDDLPVFTVIHPVPKQPVVAVKTYFSNRSPKPVTVHLATKVRWGGLAVFAGDFGIPPMLRPITLESPWLCGLDDDFGLGVIRVVRGDDAQTMINQNESFIPYGTASLGSGQTTEMEMALVCTRADMAPVSEFYLKTRNLPLALLEGTVVEADTKNPVPNAEIEITRARGKGEKTTSDGSYPLPAYAITRSDSEGRYRIFLPSGQYAMQSRTRGRPAMPPVRLGFELKAGKALKRDLMQIMPVVATVEVVDADTGEPLPAKIRFLAVPPTKINLGAPWRADGARDTVYLKPGPNRIPINTGSYRCIVSRGPEYDTWQETIKIGYEKPVNLRAKIKHVIDTPGWASVALGAATQASPTSRVASEDLVLAAAGEGLDWIVSGDRDRATDLDAAIRKQGLGRYLKASRGALLSYRQSRLFGDFYVFPLPQGVSEADLAKLAKSDISPGDFFAHVRKAFPDALICVLNVARPRASYLSFYGANHLEKKPPSLEGFSDAFDAIAVYQGKDAQVHDAAWEMWRAMAFDGRPKIVLPASCTPTLFYEEPGYPRIYAAAPEKTDPRRMSDAQLSDAIRRGRYFITNGPIVELELNKQWPERIQPTGQEKFGYRYRVKAAPWVKIDAIQVTRNSRTREQHRLLASTGVLRYPHSEDTSKGREWNLYRFHRKTGEKLFEDIYFQVEVGGYGLHPVVSQKRGKATSVFAITPPVLFDADGDGEYRF